MDTRVDLHTHSLRSDGALQPAELVRRALQAQFWSDAFEETRRKLVPKARALGIYTDEDVFKQVS